jgi:hypothetical protein
VAGSVLHFKEIDAQKQAGHCGVGPLFGIVANVPADPVAVPR